jgi:hypothetical protein
MNYFLSVIIIGLVSLAARTEAQNITANDFQSVPEILGALGDPGHSPSQLAWGHFLAIGKDGKIYAADVLNWRFQVFAPTTATGKLAKYVPSRRMFWDRVASSGWSTRTTVPKN